MTRTASRVAIVIAALCATGSAAHAQAHHEIEYQFNDQAAVIRTEDFPFTVRESFPVDPLAPPLQIVGYFPFRYPSVGLFIPALTQWPRSDVGADSLTAIRIQLTADDLVFSSDRTDPIEVDLNLDFGSGRIMYCRSSACVGIEFVTEIAVTVGGDTRRGRSMAIVSEAREPIRERSGLLESLGETPEILVEGLSVPVNEPVSMSIEFSQSIRIPTGVVGGQASTGPGSRGLGYATDRPIFTVPDGVRVDSAGGRIQDNAYVPCFVDLDADGSLTMFDMLAYQQLFMAQDFTADFDGDGELTIFDFLAFQNAFDAGCP